MKLDLACGNRCAAGYDGIDLYPLPAVRYLCDLTLRPWKFQPLEGEPFEPSDSSVEALRSSHFVEHVTDLVGFVNECHRVLVPGGELLVICPYQYSVGAWQDPTHVRAINESTFNYFSAEWRQEHDVDYYLGCTADFEVRSVRPSNIAARFMGQSQEVIAEAIGSQVNVVHELTAVLVKR